MVPKKRKGKKQAAGSRKNSLGELWRRLRFVVLAIIVYRFGAHIPIPGIDTQQLEAIFAQNQGTILSLFNAFSGGALERMSVFALGILPYISASIIMQLLVAVFPILDQLRKEGESGRRKVNQYTRYLTVLISILQGMGIAIALASQQIAVAPGPNFYFTATLSFVTGSIFLMWLGEQITEHGLGNGISVLICVSIVSAIPALIGQSAELARRGELSIALLLIITVLILFLVAFIVFFERGQRRIPIHYANQNSGYTQKQSSHLPLKVNTAGVIPAIFASSILLVPGSLGQWFGSSSSLQWLQEFALFFAPGTTLYAILFAVGVTFFCFFYTALVFNPKDVANNLKRSNAYVPGIRPGTQTESYIDRVLTRLTVFGSLYIAAVSLLPQMTLTALNIPFFFAGTSALIVVVVVMDFMANVQSHLMSYQYGSLFKKVNSRR